ncbi:hypothetical protein [Brevundimonas sp.]|uniref:hypothetical protein n=1 Tax=Brevundimonas sp. TaxID=1871086 RepID=UPI00262D0285|nr:hypothetical protein [Brevundimonas sp.]
MTANVELIEIKADRDGVTLGWAMTEVRVHPLREADLDEAVVLASLGSGALDPDHWRLGALTRLQDPAKGGVLVASTGSGRLCGLLTYRIIPGGEARPSLEVERLVAFDLIHPRAIADALIAEVVVLARGQDCDSLRLVRPFDPPADTTAFVLASGVGDLHSVF